MEKPSSVKRFEFLMYSALLIGLVGSFFKYSDSFFHVLNLRSLFMLVVPFIFVWLVARHRKDWARWVLVVLIGLGLLSTAQTILLGFLSIIRTEWQIIGFLLIQIVLEIIAFCYIFSPSSNKWFSSGINQTYTNANIDPSFPIVNQVWKNDIFKINKIFFIIYVGLIVAIDIPMAYSDDGTLVAFLYLMYSVLAVYIVFFSLETFVFRKRFSTTVSVLDKKIKLIITLRNILFLLNFIPFIQILGLIGLPTVGLILLVIYIVLITRRLNQ